MWVQRREKNLNPIENCYGRGRRVILGNIVIKGFLEESMALAELLIGCK